MLKKLTLVSLLVLMFLSPSYAAEQLTQFTPEQIPVLNELIRQLNQASYKVRTSATDTTPGYLTTEILNITVLGTVVDGVIAGWTVTDTSFKSGTGSTTVGLDSGGANPAIYCGSATPASAPFRVTNGGVVTATSGTVGGWTLATDKLSAGTDNDYIGLIPGTGIQMGDSTFGDAEFSVTNAGALKATSGTIGGWTLAPLTLANNATPANADILLDANNGLIRAGTTAATSITIDGANRRIRSSDYVSGPLGSGWNIDNNVAEFNNIRARGKISTSVFEKDSISVIGGNLLVLGGDVLDADMTALDASTMTITGDITFVVNDILRIKDELDDEWFQVTNIASAPTYTVTRDKASAYSANTNPVWKKGTAVVNYGQSGAGGAFITSSLGNSPYMDFFTHAGSPWTTTTTKTRIGNLDGIAGCSGYGIYGGAGFLGALEVIDIISIGSSGEIRSNTSGNYPYLSFSNSGLQLKDSDTGGTYGTAKYGTDKYGYGALAWILNADLGIPWAELKEPTSGAYTVASIRVYNRGANPTGPAVVGDLAVVNGKLMICTGAGTPGTWTIVGSQS